MSSTVLIILGLNLDVTFTCEHRIHIVTAGLAAGTHSAKNAVNVLFIWAHFKPLCNFASVERLFICSSLCEQFVRVHYMQTALPHVIQTFLKCLSVVFFLNFYSGFRHLVVNDHTLMRGGWIVLNWERAGDAERSSDARALALVRRMYII